MKELRDKARLYDIAQAIADIESFAKRDRSDRAIQMSATYAFIILGEAMRHLSEDTKRLQPEIPWQDIVSMRHKLVHEYGKVDLEILWKAVDIRVPELKKLLTKIDPTIFVI